MKILKIGAVLAVIMASCSFLVYALPEGESVVAGSASFDRTQADTLAITTASDRLIVDYNSFNIAAQETVRFLQPGASSIALNRVTGGDPSAIFGTLTANGQIFLVNPNGILFAPGSHVDVAGLVASTMDIDNQDFLAGRYVFSKTGRSGYIVNQGTLSANGGYVCLLAQGVDNRAAIQADLGTVALAAGEKVTLALEDANAISVVVDEAVREEVFGPDGQKMSSAVSNSGTIQAAGGKVILTAKVLNKVFDHAINNTGLINVASLVEHEGVIELVAEGAGIVNSKTGVIKADAAVASVQAGAVLLQADTILQQGLISANSLEQADAGSVTIISESSTILDEASRTEAQAAGLVGNGGQIRINATRGTTYVNKLAVVDFSAGSLAGNGGTAQIDASKQLGFYGILNGRAPPGFAPGKAFLDPEYLYIGNTSVAPNTITYADAWRDIIITGPITLGNYSTLELHADSLPNGELGSYRPDDVYDPGVGSILNPGDFTISSEYQGYESNTYLYMFAGSGVGTLDHPILTNVSRIQAIIRDNSEGDVFIEQDSMPLYARVYAAYGLVVLTSGGPVYNGAMEGPSIVADELYLEAVGGIGGEGPLRVSVNNLVAVNEGTGDIRIYNDRDLNVLAVVNRALVGYDVFIQAAGDILVRYGILSQGDVELNATGDIFLNTIADITSYVEGLVTLTAGGQIGRRDMEALDYGLLLSWDPGAEGQYFNGADNYINTGEYLGLGSGDFTLIVCYQGTQTAPYVGLIGATPGMNVGFTLENHNGYARYWLSREIFDSTMPINDGVRHQISMVREGAEGSLYIFDDEMTYAASFAVPEDSVDSSTPFWIGGWGNTRRLAQGNLDDVSVYDQALSGLEIYGQTLLDPGTGCINAGSVSLSAGQGIDVGLGQSSRVTATNNVSGNIIIECAGSLNLAADAGGWAVYNAGGGDIEVTSDENITIEGQVESADAAGDVLIEAAGNIDVADDISGNSIYLWAEGALTLGVAGGDRVMTCYSLSLSGSNNFTILSEGNMFSLDDGGTSFYFYAPDESALRGLTVISSSDDGAVTVNSPLDLTDFINLSSAGDVRVNAGLSARDIYLYADNNNDGNGRLYSAWNVLLTSKSQSFSTASDLYFEPWEGGFTRVLIPAEIEGYDFSVLLGDSDPTTAEGLWYLSALTTPFSGDIYVNVPINRTAQGQGVSLTAGQNLWINAPITTATGGISLEAPYGSIFGGLEYNGETSFTHVTTNVMVNMVAGEIIGSFIIPIRVNVSGESYYGVNLSVFGAQPEELEGPLVSAVLAGTTPSGTVALSNAPPGQVIFNGAVVWEPGSIVVPEEPGDDQGSGSGTEQHNHTELLPDQTGQVISNDPSVLDGAVLNQFQVNSPVGMLFGYRPLDNADTSAFDQFSVGADAYQLVGDELRLVGHNSLLKFFEEFDQKNKNTSTL